MLYTNFLICYRLISTLILLKLLINISLFILCCNLALEELYYLRILSLNLLEDFYSISFYLWYSFVCCTDVLTESKFANKVLFITLLAATLLSAKWFLS